jgi:N-acetylglucosamine-6-sulfatase
MPTLVMPGPRTPRPLRVLGWAVALLVTGSACTADPAPPAATSPSPDRETPARGKPSIVLIYTDDQPVQTMFAMPRVRSRLAGRGVVFRNGFVVNPLCCPSRANVLTGQFSHSTGVYRNDPPHGGVDDFDPSSTFATWLDDAGYRTGYFGKYFNHYDQRHGIPPGWDRWVAFTGVREGGRFYDYDFNVDGVIEHHGEDPRDYSTTLLAHRAAAFIRSSDGPVLLQYAPFAPHVPGIAAPGDEDAFSDLEPWRPPNFNERDVSDKPSWLQAMPRLDERNRRYIDDIRKKQIQSLLAVDRGVDRILDALAATGRLSNTLIVYTSDNGLGWGEHRIRGKQTPYEESIRVPFIVRYDPLTEPGSTDRRFVLSIDLAPTFADLAGVPAPDVDGRSLLPLLSEEAGGPATPWRRSFLIEHMLDSLHLKVPTYCALRTPRYTYVLYANGEDELYDLVADPYQLRNRADRPAERARVRKLRAEVLERCDPPPPGFSPRPG